MMSLSWNGPKRSFAAGVLLAGLVLAGCVSKACPNGQKLQSGKCVEKNGAAAHGGEDAATPDSDGSAAQLSDAATAGDAAATTDADAQSTDAGIATVCEHAQRMQCWQDKDRDGYAVSDAASMSSCTAKCPTGWTGREPAVDDVDCNDSDAKIRPRRCWRDNDMDGYASDAHADSVFCADSCGAGWTAREPKGDDIDCGDSSAYFSPEATETCEGKDNDCDGKIDEDADSSCVVKHASGVCVHAICRPDKCDTGFGDCDKSYYDGCEQPLNVADHCGECGVVCDPLATCAATKTANVGTCECQAPSFGDGKLCHGPGPIAAGFRATCAIPNFDTPSCWGVSSTATAITDGRYRQLSIGPTVGCGITTDQQLVCWGATIIPDDSQFIQVVVGADYVCALTTTRAPICWGFGAKPAAYGEASPPDEKFVQLAGGYYHVCGLHSDGTAVCWGAGSYKRTADCAASGYDCGQAQHPKDDEFVQLAAGMVHTCGLRADGTVKCWGAGVTSGTEDSVFKYGQAMPPSGEHFSWISSGYVHTCGIRQSDGKAVCWGAGQSGGSGQYDQRQSVPTDDEFLVLSAGLFQTCGLTKANAIVCWGSAADGAQPSTQDTWPLNPGL